MKRLQIMIDEDLDEELELRARAERRSKASIIRQVLRADFERNGPKPLGPDSPIWKLVGSAVDEIVYDL
jgi:hypothetical protein